MRIPRLDRRSVWMKLLLSALELLSSVVLAVVWYFGFEVLVWVLVGVYVYILVRCGGCHSFSYLL
jgi:hypothetical protein